MCDGWASCSGVVGYFRILRGLTGREGNLPRLFFRRSLQYGGNCLVVVDQAADEVFDDECGISTRALGELIELSLDFRGKTDVHRALV